MTSAAYVFLGPTLADPPASLTGDVQILPPVQNGDIYRLVVEARPMAIGLIDGAFQQVAAVWHKEILWAMAEGVHVLGAASMGALRAAELAPFGMRGVGRIFAAYRDGVLAGFEDEVFEDDDEVAVIHGPAETGYLAVSEALVNMRCTLLAAEHAGVISKDLKGRLTNFAKSAFYQERSYARLLETASGSGLAREEIADFSRWLESGRIDQKREDACELLATMNQLVAKNPAPFSVAYQFAHTTLWQNAVDSFVPTSPSAGIGDEFHARVSELGLIVWYFEDHLGEEIPRDLEAEAAARGYSSLEAFRRAMAAAYSADAKHREG